MCKRVRSCVCVGGVYDLGLNQNWGVSLANCFRANDVINTKTPTFYDSK